MKKLLRGILCFMGYHKVDNDEWSDHYGWGEEYLYSSNICKECNEIIERYDD